MLDDVTTLRKASPARRRNVAPAPAIVELASLLLDVIAGRPDQTRSCFQAVKEDGRVARFAAVPGVRAFESLLVRQTISRWDGYIAEFGSTESNSGVSGG